jgi:hypothetical protein
MNILQLHDRRLREMGRCLLTHQLLQAGFKEWLAEIYRKHIQHILAFISFFIQRTEYLFG